MRLFMPRHKARVFTELTAIIHTVGAWSNLIRRQDESNDMDFFTNPYRSISLDEVIWRNDCGFERPSEKVWEENLQEDKMWLYRHLEDFEASRKATAGLKTDELTFPAYMAKRYAPNVSPSSLLCDGLGMCKAPSCHDIGKDHTPTVKRRAMLFFEFVSGLDHGYHVVSEATQDYFRQIHEDLARLMKDFTYADEQQDKAIKKEEKKQKALAKLNMAIGIIAAIVGIVTALGGLAAMAFPAAAATAAVTAGAVTAETAAAAAGSATSWTRAMSSVGMSGARASRFATAAKPGGAISSAVKQTNTVWGAMSGGYIGVQGLLGSVVNGINHKKDLKGFDKTLEAFHTTLADLDKNAVTDARNGMQILVLGGRSRNGMNIVDLYESAFFYGSNVRFRAWVDFHIQMKTHSVVMNAQWKIEGVYIVESMAAGGGCDSDNRGPPAGKVCLPERPNRAYWLQAITNFGDGKIYHPPGLDKFNGTGSYMGFFLSDVVRSSLWWDEVWNPLQKVHDGEDSEDDPNQKRDLKHAFRGRLLSLNNTTENSNKTWTQFLEDYGNVPGAFHLPICRSWNGEAISNINDTEHTNAPCKCDAVDPDLESSWSNPNNWTMAYTKKTIKEGGWYNFDGYGKACIKHHDCSLNGSWKTLLNLTNGEKPTKHMKHAWEACKSFGHGNHSLGPPQLTDPEGSSTAAVPSATGTLAPDPMMPPAPTREPIVEVTTEDIGEVPRWPKNNLRRETCTGPHCIIDKVYRIVERVYGYNIDASTRANGCFVGDKWCVEDSAHNLCEYSSDEDDSESDDFDDEDDGSAWSAEKIEHPPKQKEPQKVFEDEIDLKNRRKACFCGPSGASGQPGISCSEREIATRTTTIKGTTPANSTAVSSTSDATATPTDVAAGSSIGQNLVRDISGPHIVTITATAITSESVNPSELGSYVIVTITSGEPPSPVAPVYVFDRGINEAHAPDYVLGRQLELPKSATDIISAVQATNSATLCLESLASSMTGSVTGLTAQTAVCG